MNLSKKKIIYRFGDVHNNLKTYEGSYNNMIDEYIKLKNEGYITLNDEVKILKDRVKKFLDNVDSPEQLNHNMELLNKKCME